MFENLIAALKAERRTIVFTEGPDARILEATARLLKDDLMDVILIGGVDVDLHRAMLHAAERVLRAAQRRIAGRGHTARRPMPRDRRRAQHKRQRQNRKQRRQTLIHARAPEFP